MTPIRSKPSQRLFILGATGGTGRALVDQALERGHSVTAFVRSPDKIGGARSGLRVVKGDPRDREALQGALGGHDAVLTTLGSGISRSTLLEDSAATTVLAMQAAEVRRIIAVSAAVLFENEGFVVWLFRNTLLKNVAKDSSAMEKIVTGSDLSWTIARPPRLTNGPLTARYALANGHMPAGKAVVSRADVAHFLLEEVERGEHIRQIVGMAKSPASGSPLGQA